MLVSVYIPTKNRLELLKRAIQSVKEQTYNNIEIIVADDGSTDGTREYLAQEMKKGLLKAIFHEKSLGACTARNTAIMQAQGDFVTGLDDDDYFQPNRLFDFVAAWKSAQMRGENISVFFDSVVVLTPGKNTVRNSWRKRITYRMLRRRNLIGSQIFAPRNVFIDSGMFDSEMPMWQDWDLWLRVTKKFGDALNISLASYVVDETHDFERITKRNAEAVKNAQKRMLAKLSPVSLRQKAWIAAVTHGYPQVKPTTKEMFLLLGAGEIRAFFRSLPRFVKRVYP